MNTERTPYPSDVHDDEWQFALPYLTLMRLDAPQRDHDLREVFNALRWMARAGAGWRLMPHDFPPLACCLSADPALAQGGGLRGDRS
jgi:transposase